MPLFVELALIGCIQLFRMQFSANELADLEREQRHVKGGPVETLLANFDDGAYWIIRDFADRATVTRVPDPLRVYEADLSQEQLETIKSLFEMLHEPPMPAWAECWCVPMVRFARVQGGTARETGRWLDCDRESQDTPLAEFRRAFYSAVPTQLQVRYPELERTPGYRLLADRIDGEIDFVCGDSIGPFYASPDNVWREPSGQPVNPSRPDKTCLDSVEPQDPTLRIHGGTFSGWIERTSPPDATGKMISPPDWHSPKSLGDFPEFDGTLIEAVQPGERILGIVPYEDGPIRRAPEALEQLRHRIPEAFELHARGHQRSATHPGEIYLFSQSRYDPTNDDVLFVPLRIHRLNLTDMTIRTVAEFPVFWTIMWWPFPEYLWVDEHRDVVYIAHKDDLLELPLNRPEAQPVPIAEFE